MENNSASINHGIDDTPFGLTNSGDNVVQVPVELKDHSKDPILVPVAKNVPLVAKKKRGRPAKKVISEVKPVREWYCSTCREYYTDLTIMKMGAGDNRYAAFCPNDQKFLSYVDEVMQKTVKDWADNNPTGK